MPVPSPTIDRIPQHGVSYVGEVNPDLVGPATEELHPDELA